MHVTHKRYEQLTPIKSRAVVMTTQKQEERI